MIERGMQSQQNHEARETITDRVDRLTGEVARLRRRLNFLSGALGGWGVLVLVLLAFIAIGCDDRREVGTLDAGEVWCMCADGWDLAARSVEGCDTGCGAHGGVLYDTARGKVPTP